MPLRSACLRCRRPAFVLLILVSLVIVPAFQFDSADAQATRKIKVAFDKIIINNDHAGGWDGLNGEYHLDVYVNEIRIPLSTGSGAPITDVDDADVKFFGPDKTVILDVPLDGSIRIVTTGFEDDWEGTDLPDVTEDLKKIPVIGDWVAGAYGVAKAVAALGALDADDPIGIITKQYGADQNFGIGGHDDCSQINEAAGTDEDQNATVCDYRLVYYIQEMGAANFAGNPVLIQSNFGRQSGAPGNFEVVVPREDSGFNFLFRNNENPYLPWYGPFPVARDAGKIEAISMIQSNFGSPGNLEVVARTGDSLVHFWRESAAPLRWHGPIPIPNSQGSAGNPVLIQSVFGERGNFELAVPRVDGGFNLFWRNNDSPQLRFEGPEPLFTNVGRIEALSFIQSPFPGPFGIGRFFDVVARVGDTLHLFFRLPIQDDSGRFQWREGSPTPIVPNSQGSAGAPSLIVSRFGDRGNFELAVPRVDGGFNFFSRNNDADGFPWNGPTPVVLDESGRPIGKIDALSLINSNYPNRFAVESLGHPGNLEVIALMGKDLVSFYREAGPNLIWRGPFFIAN